ncbi:MAG: translocation/assembly module TamB domain-containing protein [Coleofasciculus sp. G1-WW12-02]|uniref:translocation/assembly module TamB domain-containing protein n=1 Tax=Coleofasciculus sp. G1-WW12-02 TaxID=3068483 RepID=UPI0032F7BC0A
MTNSPPPSNEPDSNSNPQPESPPPRQSRRRRWLIGISIILLVGIAGGTVGAWYFIQRMLAPLVARNLTQLLQRPVEIGDVERFSLNSLRFDSAALPPTDTEPDRASIEAVEVQYDLIPLILNRRLELEVTLIEPDVYIEQAVDGSWMPLELQEGDPGPIKAELQQLRVRNAEVVLVPRSPEGKPQSPVAIAIPQGSSQFLQDNEIIRFDVQGKIASGGTFNLQGEHLFPTSTTHLQVNGENVNASTLNRLIPLPLDVSAGNVGGDLELTIKPEQLRFLGNATLNNVTAKVPQLPQPFINTNGRLRFKETTIGLEDVTTKFGQIPATANGSVDLETGFNLTAQTQAVQIKPVLQTFAIKDTPVPLSGEVKAALLVTGPLTQPVVKGEAVTTKPTQIDRVTFSTIRTDFTLTTPAQPEDPSRLAIRNLQAQPIIGGKITGGGMIELGEEGGLQLTLEASNVPVTPLAKTYNTTLPIPVGDLSGTAKIFGPLDNPQNIRATGTATVQAAGGTVTATNLQVLDNRLTALVQAQGVQLSQLADVPPQFQGTVAGQFTLSTPLDEFALSQIRAQGSGRLNVAGGTIGVENIQLSQGRWRANVDANGVQLGELAPQIPEALQEPINATFALSGSLADPSVSAITGLGEVTLTAAGGQINLEEVTLKNGRWQARIDANQIQLAQLVPQLPPQLQSPFSGTFLVSGSMEEFSPSTINVAGEGQLNVGGGTVQVSNVDVNAGRWQATVAANRVRLARVVPDLPPQLSGNLTGIMNLSGSVEQVALETIRGDGNALIDLAGGVVRARDINLAAGRWQADVQAAGLELDRLVPDLPPQLAGAFSGNFDLSGSVEKVALDQIRAQGQGRLAVAGGTVRATGVQLRDGTLQARLAPEGIELARFGEQLSGTVSGNVDVSTSLETLTPEAIARSLTAAGQLQFSQGLALIDRPLNTTFRWTGQGIDLQQLTAEGLSASGFIGVNPAQLDQGIGAIGNFNLDVAANNLDLAELSAYLPPAAADVNVAGLADFTGTIAGNLTNPLVQGNVELENFAVSGLAFEEELAGPVTVIPGEGVELDLQGETDQIELALGSDYLPVSFNIRRGDAIATGTRQGDVLRVNAENIPIALIKDIAPVPVALQTQPLVGDISGELAINLNTFDVALDQVELAGPIFGSRLPGEAAPGENLYSLSGRITQTPTGPQFQGTLDIEQGQLETLVAGLQLIDLTTTPPTTPTAPLDIAQVGMPQAKLQTQLRRLAEIETLLRQQQQAEEEAEILPDLDELDGTFSGEVRISGSLASGINAKFDLQGQDWEWGDYEVNQATLQGSFQEGVLTLLPITLQSGESFATFSGTIGGETQSGQLRLENFPIALIRDVVDLPPAIGPISGSLDATATLSGNLANPQARGAVTVTDATLNQEAIETLQGNFSYSDARLRFLAESIPTDEGEPQLVVQGSIPYQLPLREAVAPESEELRLSVNVEDEGLALLNILTRQQVVWRGGTGSVNLDIQGNFNQEQGRPTGVRAAGVAIVEGATIASQALPEPLTDVTGEIEFNFDQVDVNGLTANYGGGQITAAGTLPISEPIPQPNPLTVNIGELAINLKALYRGQIQQSQVVLTGTALNPTIGGEINLVDGTVPLPEQDGGAVTGVGTGGDTEEGIVFEFNDLKITLVEDIQIRKAPILNFLAQGTLTLNGTLDDLRPDGVIRLRRGQVNLFTTQFRLARGYEQTATFIPSQGLNPFLDVRLVASVAEATQRRLPTTAQTAEIADVPEFELGTVQTVRVVAQVEGPASRLEDQLELTSTPARSEAEIVALLGGGFVDTLGRGDSTLGLANLAGSAVLGPVGNFIADTLPLSEFRLFPTIIPNDEQRSSSLGFAAEAGIDITQSFSVSVLKELTTGEPFQYNLRYRVNDDVLLRGGTDFSEDSWAIIEYRRRF